jgi:AcrR family transcriptional regulator
MSPAARNISRSKVNEIQRGRMLAAMINAVEEVGYSNVTVAQVITRARVSRKTFYDSFSDRDDCFLAAFDQIFSKVGALAYDAYRQMESWQEGMRAWLSVTLAFLDQAPGLARFCVVEALAAGPAVLERREEVFQKVIEIIDQGRADDDRGLAGTDPPVTTAESVLGGMLAVLFRRLRARETVTDLMSELMYTIVLPYRGIAAAQLELKQPMPEIPDVLSAVTLPDPSDVLSGLNMRLTYRTMRVLLAIGETDGASNVRIMQIADIADQGQISKLLTRLEGLGLIHNIGEGQSKGLANSWHLTELGQQLEHSAHR